MTAFFSLLQAACSPPPATIASETQATAVETRISATIQPEQSQSTTQQPSKTQAAKFTQTFTPEPFYLEAVVWASEPVVPILTYHRFLPDHYEYSTKVKTRLSDFRSHLENLHASGYTLISLNNWLQGDISTPVGKRPLILTIDDAFFADQVSLTEAGEINPDSGLGVLWSFYLAHPDFGFQVSFFPSLGDKLFLEGEAALAEVIAWCIEHNAIPYNHLYTHPRLDLTAPKWITWEAEKNDLYLRELLISIDREDLISRLGNIIALPYGVWPDTKAGVDALLGYTSPDAVPLQAVVEVDYAYRASFLPTPYVEDFDRWHVPRLVGTDEAIELLTNNQGAIPFAQGCSIGPLPSESQSDLEFLQGQILKIVKNGNCQPGILEIQGLVFEVDLNQIRKLELKDDQDDSDAQTSP